VAVPKTDSSPRSLTQTLVAVVLVVFVAAVLFAVFGWLAGAFWWLVKVAVFVLIAYLIVRAVLRRDRSGSKGRGTQG
jgi:hypothetical protein